MTRNCFLKSEERKGKLIDVDHEKNLKKQIVAQFFQERTCANSGVKVASPLADSAMNVAARKDDSPSVNAHLRVLNLKLIEKRRDTKTNESLSAVSNSMEFIGFGGGGMGVKKNHVDRNVIGNVFSSA